jgi:hypothetical protein
MADMLASTDDKSRLTSLSQTATPGSRCVHFKLDRRLS